MIFPGVLHYLSTVIYVVYVEDDVDHLLLFSLITFFFYFVSSQLFHRH